MLCYQAVLEEDYYETTSIWWRLFYMTPVFFNFRMRLYTGFILSECSCIMAGLGAYPVKSDPKPGQGPSKLEQLTKVTSKDEMNFEAIHNIDEFAVETVVIFVVQFSILAKSKSQILQKK